MSINSLLILVAVIALAIWGCSAADSSQPYQIKNPELKEEISRLQQEMAVRNFAEEDTARILGLTKDPVESFYAREFAWLVKHNETDHFAHPLTFLDWYVRTGQENFCAPHEVGHMYFYVQEDPAYAEEQFSLVKQKLHLWEERQDENRKKFPQYYASLDELKELIDRAIPLLEERDYSDDTLELLEEIDLKSIC